MSNEPKSTALFYKDAKSDKEYQAHLFEENGGWRVRGLNGRRGRSLTPQDKTAQPVDYDTALKIYDKLVNEKRKKGYTPEQSGEVYRNTAAGEHFTGVVPQLLNPVSKEADIETMMRSRKWVMQEKYDGERRMIRVRDGKAAGINRTGMEVPLPVSVATAAEAAASHRYVEGNLLIDGEIMGSRYVAFDLLEHGKDADSVREMPYGSRYAILETVAGDHFELAGFAMETAEKEALIARIREGNLEGAVFKAVSAHYAPGRPASGGDQVKWKLTESATLTAGKPTTGKRSVTVHAACGSPLGKVTIPANHSVPAEGTLVEVGYLYRMPGESGALFQPVYKGERGDKQEADTLASLKVKPADVKPQVRKRPKAA